MHTWESLKHLCRTLSCQLKSERDKNRRHKDQRLIWGRCKALPRMGRKEDVNRVLRGIHVPKLVRVMA